MKASERYSKQVAGLVVKLEAAERLTVELEREVLDFCRILRRSRWEMRYISRTQLLVSLDALGKRSRRLKLVQGGNEFIARRSQANLTLIVNNETLNETLNKGA